MVNDEPSEVLLTSANGYTDGCIDFCKVLSDYLIKSYDKREKIN